jgi:hypothetical protein
MLRWHSFHRSSHFSTFSSVFTVTGLPGHPYFSLKKKLVAKKMAKISWLGRIMYNFTTARY